MFDNPFAFHYICTMESLIIERTTYLPHIILDKKLGIFEIIGRSIPKNPDEFYYPIFKWVDKYVKKPNEFTNIIIDVDYMNTASHKCLAIILNKFDKIIEDDDNFSVKVTWKYAFDDEDMLEMGEELADCNNLIFEFIPYHAD